MATEGLDGWYKSFAFKVCAKDPFPKGDEYWKRFPSSESDDGWWIDGEEGEASGDGRQSEPSDAEIMTEIWMSIINMQPNKKMLGIA